MILTNCKTDIAIILLGIPNEKGILVFPTSAHETPGIMFKNDPSMPINEQIILEVNNLCKSNKLGTKFDICQKYTATVKLSSGKAATLYTGILQETIANKDKGWKTLPELLKVMPKNRNRLPYLKAWQALTGAFDQRTGVIETDSVDKYLN